jgi:hypothetical protein
VTVDRALLAQMRAHWDGGYASWPQPVPYGSTETYAECVPWLAEVCASIEDWGAGTMWAANWVPEWVDYRPVDWSQVAADRWGPPGVTVADLAIYESTRPDGIFMRHVLEHNPAWPDILGNALRSFRKRMCLVVFTPLAEGYTRALAGGPDWSYSFTREDLTGPMGELLVEDHHVASQTAYGGEHVFRLERHG